MVLWLRDDYGPLSAEEGNLFAKSPVTMARRYKSDAGWTKRCNRTSTHNLFSVSLA